jgi:hypothetical protein
VGYNGKRKGKKNNKNIIDRKKKKKKQKEQEQEQECIKSKLKLGCKGDDRCPQWATQHSNKMGTTDLSTFHPPPPFKFTPSFVGFFLCSFFLTYTVYFFLFFLALDPLPR